MHHLTKNYCHWCRDERKKTVIEHQHIYGNAGVYRGALCYRCNRLEGIMKNKNIVDKVEYALKQGISDDRDWIIACMNKWYHDTKDIDGMLLCCKFNLHHI